MIPTSKNYRKEQPDLCSRSGIYKRVFGDPDYGRNLIRTLLKRDLIVSKKMDKAGYFIHTICVHAHFRLRGIGRFLLEAVVRDYPECFIDVNINRPEALTFYQSLGFIIVSNNMMRHQNKEMGPYNLKRGQPGVKTGTVWHATFTSKNRGGS